jgi:eukaryotic-like serine/threonine-protein kinase
VTTLAGRYELAEELGRGGMGRVVVAHDRALGRDVAIKLLESTDDPTARERFLREARSAARLHHPNVVAVYDTGEEDGRPYLVTELVRGRSLAELLRRDGPMAVDEAIGVTLGVLEGLAAAHRAGMVHRDVKPANVLLPDDGGVKLSDFGIAKALDDAASELTAAGSVMGTPTYLAPELLSGSPPSPASDLYSVGCLMYAQLTGSPPFATGEPLTIAYAHRNEPVPPIEQARSDLPPDLVAVLTRALEKDPADRFNDATTMRTALLEGPDAVPGTGAATVAMPAAAGARDATQVLGGSDGPTRAVGATPRGADPTPPRASPATRRGGGRRWLVALLVLVAIAALTWALWSVLAGDDDLAEVPEVEDETQEVEDEPEAPIEVPDEGGTEAPPAEDPPAEDPPAEEPPAEDPPTEDPPAEDPPAEEPPAEQPPEEVPPAEEPPADPPPAEDGT